MPSLCLQTFPLFCSPKPFCKSHWGPYELGCSHIPLVFYIAMIHLFFLLQYIFFRLDSSQFSSSASKPRNYSHHFAVDNFTFGSSGDCIPISVQHPQSIPQKLHSLCALSPCCGLYVEGSQLFCIDPVHTVLHSAILTSSRLCSVSVELTDSGQGQWTGTPQSHRHLWQVDTWW